MARTSSRIHEFPPLTRKRCCWKQTIDWEQPRLPPMRTNWTHSPASNRTSMSNSSSFPGSLAIDSILATHHQTHDCSLQRMWFGSFRTLDMFHCWACDMARNRITWTPSHCDTRPCNWHTNTIAWHSFFSRRALDIGEHQLVGGAHLQCCTCSRAWHSTGLSFSNSTLSFPHYHQRNRTHHGWTHENRNYWKMSCGNHRQVDSALRWCQFASHTLLHVAASVIDFAKFFCRTEKISIVSFEIDIMDPGRFYIRVKIVCA